MKFQDLNRINKEREFQEIRMSSLKSLLFLMTLGSTGIVLLWQLFERYSIQPQNNTLLWLRLAFPAFFLLNYTTALIRKSVAAIKQHLTIGFYLGALLCSLVVGYSGAGQSPYWFSLFFVLIAWFIVVPFTYKELIIHSLLFLGLFFAGFFFQLPFPLLDPVTYKMALLYAGILAMGSYSAYIRNNVEAKNYVNTKTLALKNKELSKFRHVMEQAPGSVIIMDKEMNFEYINPVFTELSGYTKEDLLSKNIKDTIYRGTTPESRVEVARILLSGEAWQGELLTFHKTGKSYWANTIASPYKDELGNIEGYIVIQQDSTERKNMEIALQESEELYRTLIEKSINGVALTRNRRFFLINQAFCDIMGYTREELMKINPESLLMEEDRERVLEIHDKRMKGEFDTLSYTARFVHKSGKILIIELNSTTVRVHGENASFVTLRDVTEQHALQQALKRSESRYKTLVENSQDGILIIRDNEVLFANNTIVNLLGYSAEEYYTMPALALLHEDDQHKALNIVEKRRNLDFSPINEEFRMITKTGQIKECETTSTLIEFDGTWASFFTITDQTESNRLQQEVKENEEKYRQLFQAESDAIFVVDADTGEILDANPAATSIYGYSREELMCLKNSDISAEPIKTTEATQNRVAMVPHRLHRKKDGTVFPVELSAGFTTLRNRNIQIVTSRDITEREAMENALRESESKYKTLIENSQDGIFAIIGDKVHFVNNTLCKMLGYSAEELYNMPAIHMVIPEDREKGLEISQRRLQGDWSTVNGIFHFVAKDGTIRECDTYSSVLELNGQTVSYITVHDLTENRRMQEKLQQSEEKYRTVIENATDGIVITQNGYLKFLNSRMCEMLQYAEEELIDIPYLNLVEEQDHLLMTEFHKRRMAGEEFTSLYRSHLKRKDGSIITVELNARTSYYNGYPAAFIIIRDISDRVKIETELQMAKHNLEKLNHELEQRVIESSESLTEARTQLINLQKENLQSQFDVLKQQVNPHFLFNSLNVLTSLIKLEPDLAEKFTEHLSKVYRYVLENKDNELVKLTTELDFLDAYIFLLNIRFMGKIVVNIRIPDDLRNCLVIPLAMQLLIENAIKHNSMSKKSPLVIEVFIDENHFLNIINNLQEREAHMASTGVGLKNIQNRYLLLNNTAPEFEKTSTHFIARIPLICDQNN